MFAERKYKGDNLFEYVVALALVGVVIGLAMFNIQQSDVLLKFIQSSVGGSVTNGTLEFGIETTGGIANNLDGPASMPVMAPPPGDEGDIYETKTIMSAPPPSSGLYAKGESSGIMAF